MEVPSNENLEQTAVSSVDAVNPHSDDVVPDSSNHRDGEQDQRDDDFSGKEVRKVLEVIASTGKFWHDWDKLKTMLSFQLKQVWGGPPFTLQRLCEILLDAKGIYPHLSKLALALEKNLLVTSTLTISTDPFPQATTVQEPDEQENTNEKQKLQLDGIENGTEPPVADKDEVMAEADTGEDMTIDTVASKNAKSSETKSEPDANNA